MLTLIVPTLLLYILWLLPKSRFKFNHVAGILAWIFQALICFFSLFDENGWKLYLINSILLVSWVSVFVVIIFKINSIWVKLPLTFFVFLSLILLNFSFANTTTDYKDFSWQMDLHISLSMLAYSLLVVATLFALSLYVHIKKIKNTQFDSNNMMSIMDEEKKLFHLIIIGWLVLTMSLLSGVVFVVDFMAQHLGHKVIFSLLAWLVFGFLILGRITKGWRGEKLVLLTILGMTSLATGYLGSKIVLEWIL